MLTVTTRERILDSARRLVLSRGFGSTTVDAVLAQAGASNGAFFHHFASKADLGRALVEEYAEQDAETLEAFMRRAEEVSADPAEQLVAFVRLFEQLVETDPGSHPGCLFVSFIYEQELTGVEVAEIVRRSIELWRKRLLEKLDAAAGARLANSSVDLPSLADQFFVVVEGGLLLSRATGDPERIRDQLTHFRHYLELLFGLR